MQSNKQILQTQGKQISFIRYKPKKETCSMGSGIVSKLFDVHQLCFSRDRIFGYNIHSNKFNHIVDLTSHISTFLLLLGRSTIFQQLELARGQGVSTTSFNLCWWELQSYKPRTPRWRFTGGWVGKWTTDPHYNWQLSQMHWTPKMTYKGQSEMRSSFVTKETHQFNATFCAVLFSDLQGLHTHTHTQLNARMSEISLVTYRVCSQNNSKNFQDIFNGWKVYAKKQFESQR